MAITNKVVTVPILGHFKEKADGIYATVEALNKKAESSALDGYIKKSEKDTELADYLKTATADGKYATKDEVLKVKVSVVEKSALEGMKESSAEGAMAIVSDDNYHIYVYDGTDWKDTGAHVDLSGYLKSTDADGKYATKSALDGYVKTEDIPTTFDDYTTSAELTAALAGYMQTATADGKYATKEEMTNLGTILGDCTFEELETNKEGATKGDCYVVTDKDNHIFYYNGTDFIDTQTVVDLSGYLKTADADGKYAKSADLSNYVLSSSLTEATEEDIDALFSPSPAA